MAPRGTADDGEARGRGGEVGFGETLPDIHRIHWLRPLSKRRPVTETCTGPDLSGLWLWCIPSSIDRKRIRHLQRLPEGTWERWDAGFRA